jgi:hypothetical protein
MAKVCLVVVGFDEKSAGLAVVVVIESEVSVIDNHGVLN